MRAPRRPGMPAKQRNSPGSGPAGPENFGYFPSLESSPPAGGISPKKRNRGFAAAAASFFLSDQKETKESPGVSFVRKAQRLRLALSLTYPTPSVPAGHLPLTGGIGPRTPLFTGVQKGHLGTCGRRGCPLERCLKIIAAALLNDLGQVLLPVFGAPKRCSIPCGR